MGTAYAVEHRLLTDVLAASGAYLPELLSGIVEGSARRTRARNISDAGYEFTIPRSSLAYAHLLQERVVHVLYSDSSEEEWRIRRIEESLDARGDRFSRVLCDHVGMDLFHRSEILEKTDGGVPYIDFEHEGPPSEHFGIILGTLGAPFITGKAPAHFAAGTIDFTDDIHVRYRGLKPWDACLEIERQTEGELFVRRNGATNWLIDLVTAVNATAPVARVEVGRSIVAFGHSGDSEDQATVVTPRGGNHPSAGPGEEGFELTVAENAFEVTAVAGNDLTLAHDIVIEDGALASEGLWAFDADGNGDAITDSTAPNIITVPGHAIAVGETVSIRKNSAGDRIIKLEWASKVATYGVKGELYDRPDIPHVNNLVPNAFLRDWTDGGRGDPFFLPPPPPSFYAGLTPNPVPIPRNPPRLQRPGGGCGAGICRTQGGSLGGDDFARPDFYQIGPGWWNGVNNFEIISGQAVGVASRSGQALFMGSGQASEFVVRADVTPGDGQGMLILKWVNSTNWVFAGVAIIGGDQYLAIIEQAQGVQSVLQTFNITDDPNPHVIKGWIRGDDVDLWYDGTSHISATIAASLDGVPGWCGIYHVDNGGTLAAFDDFWVATTNVIATTGLATGEKMDVDGTQTAESGGTATWSLGGADFPLATIELVDAGGGPLSPARGPWTPNGGIFPGDSFVKQ